MHCDGHGAYAALTDVQLRWLNAASMCIRHRTRPRMLHVLCSDKVILLKVVKVLAVDDDDFMRALIRRVLIGTGMQVEAYVSAADLLDRADLQWADLLLLDVKMPDMSGLELQALLTRRGVRLPIVFLSGTTDLAMAVTAMRNGAADFIEKPFEAASLVERIHRAIERHAHLAGGAERPPDPVMLACLQALTPREREVFELLVTGKTSKLIARELGGSFRTIEIHRARVMRKMAARHLSDLVRMSIESLTPR